MGRDSVAFRIIRGFSKICQRSAVFACRREQIRTDDKLSATAGDAANAVLGTELFTDGEAKQGRWSAPLDCIQRKRTTRVGGEALSWRKFASRKEGRRGKIPRRPDFRPKG